eukprot:m.188863 g.188863  ORF g.188863 m.188863 type:complete len:111 (+) comp39396_c0_seq1:19-351(+)
MTATLWLRSVRRLYSWDVRSAVLFEDENIVALNKPSGIPVHAGPGVKQHVLDHAVALKIGREDIPQLVHRLDKDTSGILLLSRHKEAAQMLARHFQKRLVKKIYCWKGMP